jgi:PAS domain S-box-containing protein
MAETGTIASASYSKIAAICSLFAICIGFAGLAGWIFDNHLLKTFLSDGATMKVNTALLVLFSGSSLLLQKRNKVIASRIAAVMVILLSLAVIMEHTFGANLHIDEAFFKDLATNSIMETPGRTSLLTAVSALLIGIALWAISNKHFSFAQLLGAVVFTVIYISLIGHIFKITGFYQFGKYSGVAFHTGLGLIAIAVGLIIAEQKQGWIGLLYGRLADMRSRIFFLAYVLGAAPLMAAIYLFVIQQDFLSPASDVVILILVTLILILPIAYFLLKTVGTLGKELSESDARLRIALDAAHLGVWHIDAKTKALIYNPILARIFGYEGTTQMTYEQAIGQVTDGFRDQIINEIAAAVANGSEYDVTYQQKRFNDGAIIWLRSFGKVSADEDGELTIFSGVVMDITDKVEQQEHLQQLNEEMAATVEELRVTNEELVESSNERQKLLEGIEAINEELRLSNGEQVLINQRLGEMNDMYRQAQDELTLAVNAAALATFDFNPVTERFAGNELFKAWFGLQPDDEIDLAIAMDKVVATDRERVTLAINQALNHSFGGKYDVDFAIKSPDDNESRIVRAKGQALFNEQRQPVRLTGVIQDVTELKKDEQRKNDFIGMVSHELKTPLTTLTALVQVLNMNLKLSEDQFVPGALEKATVQVKKMANMINGFLNVSRLESGKIQIEKTHFDIDELSRMVINELKLTVTDHQFELAPCSPVSVYADRDKIASVLNNLLSNAVKYSPKNSRITLTCEMGVDGVVISVKDEGFGISAADREKIFERYYRVKNENAFMASGFGIGLYLSAEIVHRHDGDIWVDSEIGKGSVFYFTLPLNVNSEKK